MFSTATKRYLVGPLSAAALAAIIAAPAPAHAVKLTDDVDLKLHLRTRFVYLEGRDNDSSNPATVFTENRMRLSLAVHPWTYASAFIQIQDVRAWGEETNTLKDYTANGLDIHQGYVDVKPTKQLTLRVGRQEINYDGQRLIGAVAWTPQARSFDAVRAMFAWNKRLWLDGFIAQVMDTDGMASPANPDRQEAGALYGRYRLLKTEDSFADVGFTSIFDFSRAARRGRWTVGLRHNAQFGILRYRVEGFYQGGRAGGQDISAYMVGGRVGVKLADPGLTVDLWGDLLSGTKDPAKAAVETFDTLYATNHKFYARTDFFLNIPRDTGGKGLVDLALKTSYRVTKPLKVAVDVHKLLAAESQGGPGDWGWGVDVSAHYALFPGVALMAHGFTLLPGSAMTARTGGNDADFSFFGGIQGDL